MALFTWVLWKNLKNRRGIICFSICARGQTKRSSFQTYIFSQGRVLCCWPRWQLKFTHTLKWTLTSESPKKELQIPAHLTKPWRRFCASRNQYLTAGYLTSGVSVHEQKNESYLTTGRYLGTEWEKDQNDKQTTIKTPNFLIWYHITSVKYVHALNVF